MNQRGKQKYHTIQKYNDRNISVTLLFYLLLHNNRKMEKYTLTCADIQFYTVVTAEKTFVFILLYWV